MKINYKLNILFVNHFKNNFFKVVTRKGGSSDCTDGEYNLRPDWDEFPVLYTSSYIISPTSYVLKTVVFVCSNNTPPP